jgi:YD repeat-containing protein
MVEPGDWDLSGEVPYPTTRNHGRLVGSRTRILKSPSANIDKTGDWSHNIHYYDDKGRTVFSMQIDSSGSQLIRSRKFMYQYNFADQLLAGKQEIFNANTVDVVSSRKEIYRYQYDEQTGQLVLVRRRVDTSSWQDVAHYKYDDLGRVKKNILGNYAEVQELDYNIRGQLAGINSHYAETGHLQGENRSFGVSLKYDYGFSDPRYDGRLSGIIWRGAGNSKAMAYGYTYDKSGRLTKADFRRYEPPGGVYPAFAWRNDIVDYTLNNVAYDRNGNIQMLKQTGVQPGGSIITTDDLSYKYENNERSNRLQSVQDAQSVNTYGLGDFQDHNQTTTDYGYDVNGNLTLDANKGITSVTYNFMNKPISSQFNGGRSIEYSYDARGRKIQELEIDGSNTKRTDYVGNYVFLNDSLQFCLTATGRTSFYSSGAPREEYFVKDHLGNVRSVIESRTLLIQEFLGSYEIASAAIEGLYFDNHNEIRTRSKNRDVDFNTCYGRRSN